MDFITDNLRLIVFAVLGILYWIGNRSGDKGAPGKPGQAGEPDANDARRIADIQAEIRRKIAERSGRPVTPQQAPRQAPVQQQPVQQRQTPYQQQQRSVPVRPVQVSQEPIFDQAAYQRDIDEKMRQVKEIEARAARTRPSSRKQRFAYDARIPKMSGLSFRQELRRDVRSHRGMQKAFLLKEILGEPVGEKGPIN